MFQHLKKLLAESSEREPDFRGWSLARYHCILPYIKDKNMLDIGCGLGWGSNHLASRGAQKVLGVDYSKVAIAEAKRRHKLTNLEFKLIDAQNLSSLGISFDVIAAFEIIEHLEASDTELFLKGVAKILKDSGVFFLSTPNVIKSSPGRSRPGNPYHVKEYQSDELFELLSRHFSRVSLAGIRCVNLAYLKTARELKDKRFKYEILSKLGQSKIVREIANLIPVKIRRRITGESKLPDLEISDFEFSHVNIEDAENIFAICSK